MYSSSAEHIEIIENIGEVVFRRSAGKRYYSIRIQPFQPVNVSIPKLGNLNEALLLVKRKEKWILKKLTELQLTEKKYSDFDFDTSFSTHFHQLKLEKIEGKKVVARISERMLTVRIPNTLDIKSDFVQKAIRYAIEQTWRAEAKQYLPQRLWQLAQKHGFSYGNISVKNLKSRWGSCSSQNNINLNLHLMSLTDELIDYVLLHELVHTKVKNHSATYWQALERVCPNAKMLDKQLGKCKIGIY